MVGLAGRAWSPSISQTAGVAKPADWEVDAGVHPVVGDVAGAQAEGAGIPGEGVVDVGLLADHLRRRGVGGRQEPVGIGPVDGGVCVLAVGWMTTR